MIPTLLATLVVGAAIGIATQPTMADEWTFWAALGAPYAALGVWSIVALRGSEALAGRLRLRGGDLAIGILMGLVMATVGFVVLRWLTPFGSPRAEWLARVYLQVGDVRGRTGFLVSLAALAGIEEVVWRGYVLQALRSRLSPPLAVLISSTAYAVAHLPSMFTLGSTVAGPNPLLPMAALFCGLCWGAAAVFLERLWPVIVAHIVFSYFMAGPMPMLL